MPLLAEVDGLARRARIALDEPPPDPALRSPGSAGAAGSEPTAADRIGLTARELDVLTLVAQGSTNREIAGALYISQKTVTVHVSRILAKLDARSRVEAAGLAQRLGLLDGEGNGQRPAG
jgi:DNA-binding NarL/FixJ family response regulator